MQGFFGKIPSHGDFITRDLSREFLDVWDDWLQSSIAESKAQLGEGWLDIYLTSPIWRFVLVPGVCGAHAWAGILMPSVDRVGRYFPLTIATSLDDPASPFQVAAQAEDWFAAVEGLALRTLDDDHFEANGLQAAMDAVAPIELEANPSETVSGSGDAWSLVLIGPSGSEIPAAFSHALVQRQTDAYSLWWNLGTDEVAPAALVVAGLPDSRAFSELLHGSWTETAAVPVEVEDPAPAVAQGDTR